MTNHEKLLNKDPVEIEAVKMLLARIYDDYERDSFEINYDKYLSLYKGMVEWLNSEVEE